MLPHLLPIHVCQHYQLPWSLERSFKLELGVGLIADRYVVGVPAGEITSGCLEAIMRELAMPACESGLLERLANQLSRASTVYFGYEGDTKTRGSLRLYFEYWDEVVSRLKTTPATVIAGWGLTDRPLWEMGIGYKWPVDKTMPSVITSCYHTDYWVQPMLPQSEILEQTSRAIVRSIMASELQAMVKDVIATILSSSSDIEPVFLQTREADSPRDSIDLCVHRYNLRLRELEVNITPIVQQFLGEQFSLDDCLQGRDSDAWITHLSAGTSRNGAPYVSLYYEPLESSGPLS